MSSTHKPSAFEDLTDQLRKLDVDLPNSDVLRLVYTELSKISVAASQTMPTNLEPTELLHEAWIRLSKTNHSNWKDRKHFYRTASRIMRFVLIDFGRKQNALKRSGEKNILQVQNADLAFTHEGRSSWLDLASAIERLEEISSRAAQVVELRFLAGLPEKEVADMLLISERTVRNDWAFAKAWLRKELS